MTALIAQSLVALYLLCYSSQDDFSHNLAFARRSNLVNDLYTINPCFGLQ